MTNYYGTAHKSYYYPRPGMAGDSVKFADDRHRNIENGRIESDSNEQQSILTRRKQVRDNKINAGRNALVHFHCVFQIWKKG
eukprot:scaffold6052_cov118-Cylindrotheca_fusiformis.AAC.15